MRDEVQSIREAEGPRAQLRRLEQAIHSELKSLSSGIQPLLDEARGAVAALFPEAGGTRLAPKEHQARHEKLLQTLDGLEDVLEALQLAARSGQPAPSPARGEG